MSASRPKRRPTLSDTESSPDVKITHIRSKNPRNHSDSPSIKSSIAGAKRKQPRLSCGSPSSIAIKDCILIEDDASDVEKRKNFRTGGSKHSTLSTIENPTSVKDIKAEQGLPTNSRNYGKYRAPATSNSKLVDRSPESKTTSIPAKLDTRETSGRKTPPPSPDVTRAKSTFVKCNAVSEILPQSPSARTPRTISPTASRQAQLRLIARKVQGDDGKSSTIPARSEVAAMDGIVAEGARCISKTASTMFSNQSLHQLTGDKGTDGRIPKPTKQVSGDHVSGALLLEAPTKRLTTSVQSGAGESDDLVQRIVCPEEGRRNNDDPGRSKNNSVHSSMVPKVATMEEVLQRYVQELHEDHKYFMKSWLQRARIARNHDSTADLHDPNCSRDSTAKVTIKKPAGFVQNTSPFASMRAIEGTEPTFSCGRISQYILRTYSGKPETRNFSVPVTRYKSEAVTVPSYTSHITLSRNILAVNDKDMKYFPYFGEDVIVEKGALFKELEQTFNSRVKDLPLCRLRAEQAEKYRPYIDGALEELGCSVGAVLRYLLEEDRQLPLVGMSPEAQRIWFNRKDHLKEDFHPEKMKLRKVLNNLPPRNERASAVAGLVCRAFLNITGFSIWHIAKLDKSLFAASSFGKLSQGTIVPLNGTHPGGNLGLQSLETYSALGCLICHVHDCPGHGEYEEPEEDSDVEQELEGNRRIRVITTASTNDLKLPCFTKFHPSTERLSMVDYLGINRDGSISGVDSGEQCTKQEVGYPDSQGCSEKCYWKKENRIETLSHWSQDQIDLFNALLPAWVKSRAGPCIIAWGIGKPCAEVFAAICFSQAKLCETLPVIEPSLRFVPRKGPQHWIENSDTWDHGKRKPFVPCSHVGRCEGAMCSCFTDRVQCEKTCACAMDCHRLFQGCNCARTAKACWNNDKCACFKLNRECDEDLCSTCGAAEVLNPVNRYNDELAKIGCSNVFMQRGVPKHTLLGHSEIQGWGLYMGEAVTAGEFLGEYKGEILSRAEADRRSAIYAQRETCYLFDLNAEQVIDSTRAGNKFRFINDSSKHNNCRSKVMFCNGVQRIGLYAERDIEIGEELFFSYNYPQEVTKHFWDRDGPRAQAAQLAGVKSEKPKVATARKVGSGKRGGARRGAGRKSRVTKAAPMELTAKRKQVLLSDREEKTSENDGDEEGDDIAVFSNSDTGDNDIFELNDDSSDDEGTLSDEGRLHRRPSRKSRRQR